MTYSERGEKHMKRIIIEGDSFESALEKGLKKLGADRKEVDAEILEEGQVVMGIVLKPYKILISLREEAKVRHGEDIFELEYRQDGVYLKVLPPSGQLNQEQERAILEYINRKGLEGLQRKSLFQAIYPYSGQWMKIAPPQLEKKVDEEIEIFITADRMKAYITLLPPLGGEVLSKADIIKLLNSQNVVFGIDEGKIDRLLNKREYGSRILIAEGIEPKNGVDGEVLYHISLEKNRKPLIKEDGNVDYYHLDIVENVAKGQLLATIVPPTDGTIGKTVTGDELLPKPGRDVRIGIGKNVVLSEDGLELFSEIDGRVELIGNRIHVYNTLEINGDVDTSTGNIDFIGNVIVNGNVLTGFEVNAKGHIKVLGVVEGAKIDASGDVVIRKGIQGLGKGTVKAGGKIVCRFIENANVYCNGDVISEAIMHSQIQSGGHIQVAGKKGLIVGGNIKAAAGITASTIGSPMATSTILEVGLDPSLRNEYKLLEDELKQLESEFKKSCQILNLLTKLDEEGRLPEDKKPLKEKVLRTQNKYNEKLPSIRARMAELEEIFSTVANGSISARNIIYPGVKIIIGTSNMDIYEDMKYVTFNREHGEISFTSFTN